MESALRDLGISESTIEMVNPAHSEVHPLVEKPFELQTRLEPGNGLPHRNLCPLVIKILGALAPSHLPDGEPKLLTNLGAKFYSLELQPF